MHFLSLWLSRLVDALDAKIDAWWRDKPILPEDALDRMSAAMQQEMLDGAEKVLCAADGD